MRFLCDNPKAKKIIFELKLRPLLARDLFSKSVGAAALTAPVITRSLLIPSAFILPPAAHIQLIAFTFPIFDLLVVHTYVSTFFIFFSLNFILL